MDSAIKCFVGLDVHKDSIAVAYATADSRAEPRFVGTIDPTSSAVLKALRKLGSTTELAVCYEAGPCGYNLVRALREQGFRCDVIAPSRVARHPADRIKTDRRDALLLARLCRAGELTSIVIPDPADEAIRDLMRSREDAVNARRRARQQLRSFLLRHGHAYHGVRAWGPTHDRWMAVIAFSNIAHQLVFTDYRLSVRSADERLARIETSVHEQVNLWRWRPVVRALMTMRGIDLVSAATIICRTR